MFRCFFVGFVLTLFVACGGDSPAPAPTPGPTTSTTSPKPKPPPAPTVKRELKLGKEVKGDATRVPYILWGGDMATFYANGGLRTRKQSLFDQQGLVIDLVDGNDFDQQVKDYKSGKSPFLRGTFRMIGLASETIGTDPGKRPLVFLQMTWSAGDHLVARGNVKTLSDLKGKTIAIQRSGPHVGMLDDVLADVNLSWKDVTIKWADDITGPGSPPEMFRKDASIDAAFAITPDMIGLTGGLENTGTGAEGTVKGARVAVSTADRSRSIADVYAVSAEFWKANPQFVTLFAATYLKSVEEVIDLKKKFESGGSDPYMDLLQLSQNIFGADAIPTLEEDAHGLLSDCTFAGHPGNVSFFTDPKNLHGFDDFNTRSLDLAVAEGYAKTRIDLQRSPIDWQSPQMLAMLTKTKVQRGKRFDSDKVTDQIERMDQSGELDSRTLLAFTISFQPNQTEFDARQYAAEYKRVYELADRYGNAVIAIRGHSDTTLVLKDAVKAGLENGGLTRTGTSGNYTYKLDGRTLDITDPRAMQQAIASSSAFKPTPSHNPQKTLQAALNLSRQRAEAVKASMLAYGKANGVKMDESQVQAQGVGIREPIIARPRNPQEAGQNMRVEFRLVRVSAEAMTTSDFDF